MRLLALDGQRLAAMQQFELCRRTMRAEMDVEPETETLALYEQIRSAVDIEPAPRHPPHNLQAQLTPLIGREKELAAITEYLGDTECRLLVLVGPGGSGKSRLAIEAAQHLLPDFADGVFLVSLASLSSTDSLIPVIAQAIGLNLYDTSSPATQMQQYLRSKRILLVLDSFEHMVDSTHEINRLLHETRRLRILVTSRARLNLKSEQVFRLGGLDTPDDNVAAGETEGRRTAADYPAVQLFVYQARRSLPQLSPTEEEMAAIVRICRAVNGLPLSILLAASWADLLTVTEIAERVTVASPSVHASTIDFLETDWQDLAPRQRSMRTVLDHSWRLLDETGKRLLARLSVFRGDFSHEAAHQIAGASLRQLKALVDRSLLESTQAGKYALHEHLRQYASERLEEMEPDAAQHVSSQHAKYYIRFLRECGGALHDRRQLRAVAELSSEFDNIRSAWRWSAENADCEKISDGADGLFDFLIWKFRLAEGRTLFGLAEAGLRESGRAQIQQLAEVLTRKATFCRLLGNLQEARCLITEAQGLVEVLEKSAAGVERTRALVLDEFGHIVFGLTPTEAERMWRESLALFRNLGDQWHVAQVLNDLASAVDMQADWGTVCQLYEEALQIQSDLGDQRGRIRSLHGLSCVADNQGRIEDAVAYYEESKRISRTMGDLYGAVQSDLGLAIERMYLGQFADACTILTTATDAAEELGAVALQANVLQFLAWASINVGAYAEARQHNSRALALFRQVGEADGIAYCNLCKGERLLAEGDIAQARLSLRKALTDFVQ
ncbi:MAG: ATP-binding protein, partial [Caldilineaceae bacterium]